MDKSIKVPNSSTGYVKANTGKGGKQPTVKKGNDLRQGK